MTFTQELQTTINQIVQPDKGILAADESLPTIAKRFAQINVKSTGETRRAYRSLLLSTPQLENYISGVIFFEETLGQSADDGVKLPVKLAKQGIVVGVKVDLGTGPLALSAGDKITFGLDGLAQRLQHYKKQGARFAKWRATYQIGNSHPSALGVSANAEMLARYAAVCQEQGIVPIVEPEVLMEGSHSLQRCAEITETVQREVFQTLHRHHVQMEQIILKPNMIAPGSDHPVRASSEEIVDATIRVLGRTVPAAVPSINFLSGGMSPEQATANLNALNAKRTNLPWLLSYSFGRALQQPVLHAWQGEDKNIQSAQHELLKRARMNSLAQTGKYEPIMENQQ